MIKPIGYEMVKKPKTVEPNKLYDLKIDLDLTLGRKDFFTIFVDTNFIGRMLSKNNLPYFKEISKNSYISIEKMGNKMRKMLIYDANPLDTYRQLTKLVRYSKK